MKWLMCLLIVVSASVAWGASLTVDYTEPTASGTLAYTRIYWCKGATCTTWLLARQVASDDGNGGDAQSIAITIPLVPAELPVTVRVRVTATDTSGNETDGAIDTFQFTAS